MAANAPFGNDGADLCAVGVRAGRRPISCDWSHEYVVLAGVTTKVKVAHVRLCHSRMFFVRA